MKNVHVYDIKNQWVGKLYYDNSKKVIVCLSKSIAIKIHTILSKKGESTLLLTGDSPYVVKNHDPNTLWNQYHNVIYTPTISNSISFELEHFDTLYVYGCRGSGGPEDLVQMMGRVRCIKNTDIHIHCSNIWYKRSSPNQDIMKYEDAVICNDYLPLSEEAVTEDMKSAHILFKNEIYKPFLAEVWESTSDTLRSIYTRVYSDRGLGQRCFRYLMMKILEEELGYNIIYNAKHIQEIKLSKDIVIDNTNIDLLDYNTYVDSNYIEYMGMYKESWCIDGGRAVKNIASMRRDRNDGDMIFYCIQEMFKIGTCNLDKCIEDRSNSIVLKYVPSSNVDMKKCMMLLGGKYYGKYPSNKIWDWTFNFIVKHLLMKCTYTKSGINTKNAIYTYEIDMTDWIYYHIKK